MVMYQESSNKLMNLPEANLSFAVAVIPTLPLKEQIASASLAIAQRFDNNNIIDNQKFPAHISLYLGGTDYEFIDSMSAKLQIATTQFLLAKFVAEKLYYGNHGFIGIQCSKTNLLLSLMQVVVDVCGELHRRHPRYRPHLIKRWPQLTKEKRELLHQYGTYKIPAFHDSHFSVAKVPELYTKKTLKIAQEIISLPKEFGIERIQIVDIGHQNERWIVLHQWPVTKQGSVKK